jgi:hypothetical protein
VILLAAVLIVTVQAIVINRLAGLPYPLWVASHSTDSARS